MQFTIKRNDTKIRFTDIPTVNGIPLTPEELTGCTVSFLLGDNDGWSIKREAVITPLGSFEYDPVPEDVSRAATCRQEWELRFPDGKPLTFPNDGYNIVDILPDVG